jgi:hypothetical protein
MCLTVISKLLKQLHIYCDGCMYVCATSEQYSIMYHHGTVTYLCINL